MSREPAFPPGTVRGVLIVLREADPADGNRRAYWCKCSVCERERVVRHDHLIRPKTKCGCKAAVKDGRYSMPENGVWRDVIGRCTYPAAENYPAYGGRGITVCPEWLADFWSFYNHVGPRPSPTHQLDRIDNEKGYEPGNVRWATRQENARHKRTSRLLEAFGRVQCASAWADECKMPYPRLLRRLGYGWSVERALTEPYTPHSERGRRRRAAAAA